jgi:hypothetical protein
MQIYRLKSQERLFGFEDEVGCMPILGKTLKLFQENEARAAGCQLIDIESPQEMTLPALMFPDYFLFSSELLLEAKKNIQAKSIKRNVQFTLAENSFNRRFLLPIDPSQHFQSDLDLFYTSSTDNEQLTKIQLDQSIVFYNTKIPSQIVPTGVYDFDVCRQLAGSIISPFHLLQINLAVLNRQIYKNLNFLERRMTRHCEAFSKNFYRILSHKNVVGKNCHIHPTARLEGAILGDNCRVGAGSIIRLSQLGDSCVVEDHCAIKHSVLGAGTYISHGNLLANSCTYENVFLIHGPYQFSIFGQDSAAFAVINCDLRMDNKTITIPTGRGYIDSNQHLLGVAYGHRSKVSGGNIIAPGRIVPNDWIQLPPDSIINKFKKPHL